MFGKGVDKDKMKAVEMYGKCGVINDDELVWMRKLSNDKFVCGEVLELDGLFSITYAHLVSLCCF